jgi:hypothetical protein
MHAAANPKTCTSSRYARFPEQQAQAHAHGKLMCQSASHIRVHVQTHSHKNITPSVCSHLSQSIYKYKVILVLIGARTRTCNIHGIIWVNKGTVLHEVTGGWNQNQDK